MYISMPASAMQDLGKLSPEFLNQVNEICFSSKGNLKQNLENFFLLVTEPNLISFLATIPCEHLKDTENFIKLLNVGLCTQENSEEKDANLSVEYCINKLLFSVLCRLRLDKNYEEQRLMDIPWVRVMRLPEVFYSPMWPCHWFPMPENSAQHNDPIDNPYANCGTLSP